MSSIEPDDGSGEINGSEEVTGRFVVACGNGAILLEFTEEILDQMACLIQLLVVIALLFTVSLGWNNRRLSRFL